MPTYEYLCQKCNETFEVFQSMKDDPLKTCTCGKKGKVRRLVGRGAGIIFKGSGFYETDYKRPARAAEKTGKSGGSATSGSSGAKSGDKPAPSSSSAKK